MLRSWQPATTAAVSNAARLQRSAEAFARVSSHTASQKLISLTGILRRRLQAVLTIPGVQPATPAPRYDPSASDSPAAAPAQYISDNLTQAILAAAPALAPDYNATAPGPQHFNPNIAAAPVETPAPPPAQPPPPPPAAEQWGWTNINSSEIVTGQAAYYCAASTDANTNMCGFQPTVANATGPVYAFPQGVTQKVALNWQQWGDGIACGLCIAYRGTGGGSGSTPLPSNWKLAQVFDGCATCEWGGLNICNPNGDGSWDVEWYPVPCDHTTASSDTLRYEVDFANEWWMKFSIANARVPIKTVQWRLNDTSAWQDVQHTAARWIIDSPDEALPFPLELQLTSVLGDVVTDAMPSIAGGAGQAQFTDAEAPAPTAGTSISAPAPQ